MPRITKRPVCFIALSPAAIATAIGVKPQIVYDAILSGELGPVYQRGLARRILISNAEQWMRDTWKKAKPKAARKTDVESD
jgi:hypothetical protein